MTHPVPALDFPTRLPVDPMPPMDPATVFPHVAHELRQPLSAMESIAYYLEMILPPEEGKARQQLQKLHILIQQTNGILSDAIQLLRPADVRPELMDLNELVCGFVAELAAHERLNLTLSAGDHLPLVRLDPIHARHLLGNLLRCARRLAPAGEGIFARTCVRGDEVLFEVTFPAPGCAAGELQSFLDQPEMHLSAGFGLALASIRRILDAHQGRIQVRPEAGVRVSFTVALPSAA